MTRKVSLKSSWIVFLILSVFFYFCYVIQKAAWGGPPEEINILFLIFSITSAIIFIICLIAYFIKKKK